MAAQPATAPPTGVAGQVVEGERPVGRPPEVLQHRAVGPRAPRCDVTDVGAAGCAPRQVAVYEEDVGAIPRLVRDEHKLEGEALRTDERGMFIRIEQVQVQAREQRVYLSPLVHS